jgi:hypothetical protein
MSTIFEDNSLAIGRTPLVKLNRVVGGANVSAQAWYGMLKKKVP